MGSIGRRQMTIGLDRRGKAHAGVATTLDQRVTRAESFEDFCHRQQIRVRQTLGFHVRRFRQRRAELATWEHAGLSVKSHGQKQPAGSGSYATREALAREGE